jgi:hypothetical protein
MGATPMASVCFGVLLLAGLVALKLPDGMPHQRGRKEVPMKAGRLSWFARLGTALASPVWAIGTGYAANALLG